MNNKMIITTSNLDGLFGAHLMRHMEMQPPINFSGKIDIKTYAAPWVLTSNNDLVFIRSWVDIEQINNAVNPNRTVTIIDGTKSNYDKQSLNPGVIVLDSGEHGILKLLVRRYNITQPQLLRAIEYICDYDSATFEYPETPWMINYMRMELGAGSPDQFLTKLILELIHNPVSLANMLAKGKVIETELSDTLRSLATEGIVTLDRGIHICNGSDAVKYMPKNSILNITYTIYDKGVGMCGYVPDNLLQEDKSRIQATIDKFLPMLGKQERNIDVLRNFYTLVETIDVEGFPKESIDLDRDDVLLPDEVSHETEKFLRLNIAKSRANEFKTEDMLFMNTQYLGTILADIYMDTHTWSKYVTLWCVRKDAMVRYVTLDRDNPRAVTVDDICLMTYKAFTEWMNKLRK